MAPRCHPADKAISNAVAPANETSELEDLSDEYYPSDSQHSSSDNPLSPPEYGSRKVGPEKQFEDSQASYYETDHWGDDKMARLSNQYLKAYDEGVADICARLASQSAPADIIDMRTGKIIEDHGHIKGLPLRNDVLELFGGENSSDWDSESDDEAPPAPERRSQPRRRAGPPKKRLTLSEQLRRHMEESAHAAEEEAADDDAPVPRTAALPTQLVSDFQAISSVCFSNNPLLDWIVETTNHE